jgi:hypothetical protein
MDDCQLYVVEGKLLGTARIELIQMPLKASTLLPTREAVWILMGGLEQSLLAIRTRSSDTEKISRVR